MLGLWMCNACHVLTPPRYIQLQEEYIKDEQRYVLMLSIGLTMILIACL